MIRANKFSEKTKNDDLYTATFGVEKIGVEY